MRERVCVCVGMEVRGAVRCGGVKSRVSYCRVKGRMRRALGSSGRCGERRRRCEGMGGVARREEWRSGRLGKVNAAPVAAAAANIPVPAMEQLARCGESRACV